MKDTETPINTTLHPEPTPLPQRDRPLVPAAPVQVLAASDNARPSSLSQLLDPPLAANLPLVPANQSLSQPATDNSLLAVVEAQPLPVPTFGHQRQRNGRVARLPKPQRDMVSRMLWNGVPYKNIAAALDDAGFTITERQISSWATGGYLEWEADQEHLLNCRLDQDRLLQFLRRDDAPELAEMGLQAAANRLSQFMLQKLARGDDPEANLPAFTRTVELLCRLNRELTANQKGRDDSRLTLGSEHNPARVKEEEEVSAIEDERFYSDPPADSGLEKPKEHPLLPQIPTAVDLAEQTRQEEEERHLQWAEQSTAFMKSYLSKVTSQSTPPATPAA